MEKYMQGPSSQLKRSIIYSAAAGAGKTTQLVDRVFTFAEVFYKEHDRYPRIIVATFTRKATQELRERLRKRAIESGSQGFIQFTLSKNNLMIKTIDGVLQLLIRRYGMHLGIDSDFRFITGREKKREAKKILKELIESCEKFSSLLEDYTLEELTDCFIELERRMLLSSLEWSFYRFPDLEDRAWRDYHHKVKEPLGGVLKDLECCDHLNKSWEKLKKQFEELYEKSSWKKSERIQRDDSFKQKENEVSWSDFYKNIKDIEIKKCRWSKDSAVSKELKVRVDSIIDELKRFDDKYDIDFWKRAEQGHKVFQELSREFHSRLWDYRLQQGCLTEEDLGPIGRYLLKKYPKLAESFSQEWDYWLIDEFQDISPDQVEILKVLVGTCPQFIVGDSQQSIYLFRGARPDVFRQKIGDVESLKGEVKEMSVNYRSIPPLVAFINQLFQKLNPKQFKKMFSEEKKLLDPNKNVANFYIGEKKKEKLSHGGELAENFEEKGGTKSDIKGEEEGRHKIENEKISTEQEMDFIRREINRLFEKNPEKQIAVLCQTNQQVKVVDRFLSQSGLVTQIFSSGVFGKRREIQDLIQIIKVLVNPYDDFSLVGVLRSPWFFVDEAVLVQFIGRKKSLWSEIKNRNINSIELLKSYQEKAQKVGLTETLVEIIIERGLLKSSLALDPTGQREANICKFISLLQLEDHRSGFNCLEFISNMELDNKEEDAVSSVVSQRVRIMTIHKAKGLQFDYVFIPFIHKKSSQSQSELLDFNEDDNKYGLKVKMPLALSSNLDPHKRESLPPIDAWRGKRSQWESDERERLFYVAVTRAKEEVWITGRGKCEGGSILEKINASGFFNDSNFDRDVLSIDRRSSLSEKMCLEQKTVEKMGMTKINLEGQRRKCHDFTYTFFHELNGGAVFLEKEKPFSEDRDFLTDKGEKENRVSKPKLKPIEWGWRSCLAQFQSVSDLVRQSGDGEGSSQQKGFKDFMSSRSVRPADKINYIEKTLKGSQIHTYLEQIFYCLSYGRRVDDSLLKEEWVQYILKLEEPPMARLLKSGESEWPYLYKKSNSIIEGRIDLWGDVDGVRWIVDYKTGSHNQLREEGFCQMRAYAEALDSKCSVEDVRLVLLYPLSRKVYTEKWEKFNLC